jgi:hypothetical protein
MLCELSLRRCRHELEKHEMHNLIRLLEEALSLAKRLAQAGPSPTPPLPANTSNTPPLAWGKKVSAEFKARVWWIAETLTEQQGALFDANWLMGCMAFESGRSFRADKKNPQSSATGLIQFMRATAIALDTTVEALARMSAEDQLNYVYKYFSQRIKEKGAIRSLEDCYMAILWPAAVGKPSEFVLWSNGEAYRVNRGLDKNRNGAVTKAEAAAHVASLLAEGMQPENYG